MVTILPKEQIKQLREALESSKRPLFYYDDDPDGLCSFLLLYRFIKEGKGVMVKTTSNLTKEWARYAREYSPDNIFILDVPVVEQEFIDEISVPIYWIDHHMPVERTKINYYNPRLQDIKAYIPTTRMAYEVVKQDIWIAAVGCVADWYLPDFKTKIRREYPELLNKDTNDPESALFKSTVGKLARIFAFLLKGKTGEVLTSIKILTKITSPNEILLGTTPAGKNLRKRFENINVRYEALLQSSLQTKADGSFFFFKYAEDQWSFSSELSNELAYRYPTKTTIVCREKDGEYKCSFRSRDKPILPALQKALEGVEGRGGGHDNACGAAIKSADFERFMQNLKNNM